MEWGKKWVKIISDGGKKHMIHFFRKKKNKKKTKAEYTADGKQAYYVAYNFFIP